MNNKEMYNNNINRLDQMFKCELVSAKEAAAFVGVDVRTFIANAPVTKLGNRYFISKTQFANWLS